MSSQVATDNIVPKVRFREFSGQWKRMKIACISDGKLQNGVFNDPNKTGRGYRLINVLDMYTPGTIEYNGLSLVDIDAQEFERNKVRSGDIFFTRSSLVKSGIAYSNILVGEFPDVTFDGHLIRLRVLPHICLPLFLNYAFKCDPFRRQVVSFGKTATMTVRLQGI
jgi:type I restriction enzyme S subunit